MKKEKRTSTLSYIASVMFYLAAIIGFASGSRSAMPIVWFCLGSACLCLGTVYKRKETEDDDQNTRE